MTARCIVCGRIWNISVRQNPKGYICPDCEYRNKLKATGKLKEGDPKSAKLSLTSAVVLEHGVIRIKKPDTMYG